MRLQTSRYPQYTKSHYKSHTKKRLKYDFSSYHALVLLRNIGLSHLGTKDPWTLCHQGTFLACTRLYI